MGACALKAVDDSSSDESWQEELTDSKRLTEKKRERLAETIRGRAILLGLGRIEAEEIDRIGLAEALRMAARMALFRAIGSGDFEIEEVVIDGPQNFLKGTMFEGKVTTMNKADLLVKPVSAAAIVAKVYRDGVMRELASEYPRYDFEHNVGYGTKKHLEALAEIGPCAEHRFSYKPVQKACEGRELEAEFLERFLRASGGSDIAKASGLSRRQAVGKEALLDGRRAEMAIADYLRRDGQTILVQNFRTRSFEIDIVSATAERIYFTEVKYRKNARHGSAVESVTKEKRERMRISAEAFMARLAVATGRKLEDLPAPQLAVGTVEGVNFEKKAWFPLG